MRYKVKIELKSAVAFAHPITFDAIVWHCFKKAATSVVLPDDLPIDKFKNGVYKAGTMTVAVVDNLLRAEAGEKLQDYMTSYESVLRFSKPLYQMDVFQVGFIFETGKIDEVYLLLTKHLKSIGAVKRSGYGIVGKITYEETKDKIIRPVPVTTLKELTGARIIGAEKRAFRPPYNYESNVDSCLIVEF